MKLAADLLTWWLDHRCEGDQAGELYTLLSATVAAVAVAAAACTVAGADLPDALKWPVHEAG